MKIQLVGKVTGLPRRDAENKFDKYEKLLSSLGHQVVNPLNIVHVLADWESAMETCLKSLIDQDAIFLLPDWHRSLGAKIEVCRAIELSKNILTFYDYEHE